MKKLKIKGKLLAALIALALLFFSLVGAFTWIQLSALGNFALRSVATLGKAALTDSEAALYEQATREMTELAEDQALIVNSFLEGAEVRVESIADLCASFSTPVADSGRLESVLLPADGPPPANVRGRCSYALPAGMPPDQARDELGKLWLGAVALMSALQDSDSYKLIFLASESGLTLCYPWQPLPKEYKPDNRAWWSRSLAAPGKRVWTGPYPSSTDNKLVITCSQLLELPGQGRAVVGLDISTGILSRDFSASQKSRKGYAFIFDAKGDVIASEELSKETFDWNAPFKTKSLLELRRPGPNRVVDVLLGQGSGVVNGAVHGVEYYVAHAPVEVTGWKIGVAMPASVIVEPSRRTEAKLKASVEDSRAAVKAARNLSLQTYAAICALLLLFSSGAIYLLASRITAPILCLKQGVDQVGDGNLDFKLTLRTGDEIQELAERFNHMTAELKKYIEEYGRSRAARISLERELEIAAEIQLAMLPASGAAVPGLGALAIHGETIPAKQVGGDFYDYFLIDAGHLFFCVGDVSGKGVPAALFMVNVLISLRERIARKMPLTQALGAVNDKLEANNGSCMFATAFCGALDLASGAVDFVNCGHNPPLLLRASGEAEYLRPRPNKILGPFPTTPKSFKAERLQLAPGDLLLVYSDGITEALGPTKELYGPERFRQAVLERRGLALDALAAGLKEALAAHRGAEPQSDDITLLAIKFGG